MQRRASNTGIVMVVGQKIALGRIHALQTVTIHVVEDTLTIDLPDDGTRTVCGGPPPRQSTTSRPSDPARSAMCSSRRAGPASRTIAAGSCTRAGALWGPHQFGAQGVRVSCIYANRVHELRLTRGSSLGPGCLRPGANNPATVVVDHHRAPPRNTADDPLILQQRSHKRHGMTVGRWHERKRRPVPLPRTDHGRPRAAPLRSRSLPLRPRKVGLVI